jgi:hypothetical protein
MSEAKFTPVIVTSSGHIYEAENAGDATHYLYTADQHKAASALLDGGKAQTEILRRAQNILTLFISPDRRIQTERECVDTLLALLDGPAQRKAQALWDAAAKATSQ